MQFKVINSANISYNSVTRGHLISVICFFMADWKSLLVPAIFKGIDSTDLIEPKAHSELLPSHLRRMWRKVHYAVKKQHSMQTLTLLMFRTISI